MEAEAGSLGRQLDRYYHAGRHYRPSQIAARLHLIARRRLLHPVQGVLARPRPGEARARLNVRFLPGLSALGAGALQLADREALAARAAEVRRRRFTFLSRTVEFTQGVDWNPRGLPELWRCQLNYFEDVLPLVLAAACAPDSAGRRAVYDDLAALVRSWISGCRPGRGVGWWSYPLSRRIPNWIYAYTAFAPEIARDGDFREIFLASLFRQAAFLEENIERDVLGNHLIANGRALFLAGLFFDGLRARRWLERGRAILWRELGAQVRQDGGHYERSPMYHARVLADYLEVAAALLATGYELPPWVGRKLRAMADFLSRILHPDGDLPLFHDTVLGTWPPPHDVLAVAAALLRAPELVTSAGATAGRAGVGLWALLFGGEAVLRRPRGLTAPPRPGRLTARRVPRALRRSAYYVMPGAEGDLFILDGGGVEPPHLPAHSHCNIFGYELSVGGQRLLVDAGVAEYQEGPWRSYFRSTRAHNTVAVDGAEQSDLFGSFRAGRRARVVRARWWVREGLVAFEGAHDGFAVLAPGLRHTRRVFCLPGSFWVVADELTGDGEHTLESFIHLHPEAELRAACDGTPRLVVSRGPAAALEIVPCGVGAIDLGAGRPGQRLQGWYAPRFGEVHPAAVITLAVRGALPLLVGYALVPRPAGPTWVSAERVGPLELLVRVGVGGTEYRISSIQDEIQLEVREGGVCA